MTTIPSEPQKEEGIGTAVTSPVKESLPDKLWCETCEGEGECMGPYNAAGHHSERMQECPDCDGKGYWMRKVQAIAAPREHFPRRIWELLKDVADRTGKEGFAQWEDGNGEPLQDDAEAALAWIAAPREGWQPIRTAPSDKMLLVGWLDAEDDKNPERHDFDQLEDGVWQVHANNVEYFQMCAPAGSRGPKEDPPYTHFMEIGALPAAPLAVNAPKESK